MISIHLRVLLVANSALVFCSQLASASLMRRPSKSECKRYARENNACENNSAFMKLYCDKFLTCIEHDREVRDNWGGKIVNTMEEEQTTKNKDQSKKPIESFYDLEAKYILGSTMNFNRFRGKVVLIVNVASECGFTDQHYLGLMDLYDELTDTGKFEILAFPCNQFGGQEPGTDGEIKEFTDDLGVEFIMMQKIDVNGANTHPVYKYLKEKAGPKNIEWNFNTYYIVDPEGNVMAYNDIKPHDIQYTVLERFFPDFLEDDGDDDEMVDDEDDGEETEDYEEQEEDEDEDYSGDSGDYEEED